MLKTAKLLNLLPLVLVLPTIFYLLKPGYFPMHDDTQPVRIDQMAQALRQLQFPVRWVGDLGYGFGYPIFNFYNPLVYYLGAGFELSGINPIDSAKIVFGMSLVIAGVTMFLLARKFWGFWGGLLSATFYAFAPYHAIQVFVRGSLAESFAYALLPLVFLGIIANNFLLISLATALLILSHNLVSLAALSFITVMILATGQLKDKFMALVAGIGLSAFFWLPAVVESRFTGVAQMVKERFNPLDHFVYPAQLWTGPWGFGGSAPGVQDGMSFQLGKLFLLAILASLFLFPKIKAKKTYLLFLVFFAISVFLVLPYSAFIWGSLSFVMAYFQFPWRFLVFTSFFGSLIVGAIGRHWLILPLVLAIIFFNFKYFQPQYLYDAKLEEILSADNLRWKYSQVSDEYLPAGLPRPQAIDAISPTKFFLPNGKINVVHDSFTNYKLEAVAEKEQVLKINIANFPGWKIYVNGREIENPSTPLLQAPLGSGESQVEVKFADTWVRKIANCISILFLAGIASKLLWKKLI